MDFEYDPSKSEINKNKHGIDFEDAKAVWEDPQLLEIEARSLDEPRYLLIGKIGSRHFSTVITYRNNKIRIISVRRSRKEEVELYEKNKS